MNVLLDTNIMLDYLQHRADFDVAEKIINLCARKELNCFMAAHSVPNMFFILRKVFSEEERRELLLGLIELIPVVSIDHEMIAKALNKRSFSDFEDCLQSECASSVDVEYIITRNVSDFAESHIPAIHPNDFWEMYGNWID